MSTLQSRRSPLDVIRALREAKKLGSAVPLDPGFRESLAEALEPRQLLTVTTANLSPPTSATEGNVAYFYPSASTDHDPATTTWTIQFGDGTSLVTTVNGSASIGHTYAAAGSYTASATVTDTSTGGTYYSCFTSASVADGVISGSLTSIAATEGAAFSGVIAHFTDTSPNKTAADFTANAIFGDDGTISYSESVVADGGGFDVVATHTFTAAATYTATVSIHDNETASLSTSLSYSVAAVTPTLTVEASTVGIGTTQDVEVDVAGYFTSSQAITLSGYDGTLISVSPTSFSWNGTSETAHYLVTGLAAGSTAITAAVTGAVPVSGAATVVPDVLGVNPTSITLCWIGNGNASSPIAFALTTNPTGIPAGVGGAVLDVSSSAGVDVPATITTAANGGATLVISPEAGEGDELVGGEGKSVVNVYDTRGGPTVQIVVTWVLPELIFTDSAIHAGVGGLVTTTVTLVDPTTISPMEGVALNFNLSDSRAGAVTASDNAGTDATGTVASGLPDQINITFIAVTGVAVSGDTGTLTLTVPGISSSLVSASCTFTVD